MTVYVASGNAHKVQELRTALPHINFVCPRDEGIAFDFDETGDTFAANSMGKALALWHIVHKPVLADDSGLCVDALGGRPGIFSARYGSENGVVLSAPERNSLLLSEMRGQTRRSCRFVCALTLVLSKDRLRMVQESCEGAVLEAPTGSGGFGYDPIFFVTETQCGMAELSEAQKNAVSHRGRALNAMAPLLSGLV